MSSSRPQAEELRGGGRIGNRRIRPQHRPAQWLWLPLRASLPQVQHLARDLGPSGRIRSRVEQARELGPSGRHLRLPQARELGPPGRHLRLQLQTRPRICPRMPGQTSHLPPIADVAVCRPCRLPPMSSSPQLHQSLWIGTPLRHQHLRIGHQSQPCCFHQIGYGIWWGALDGLAHGLEGLHLAS